MDECWSLPQPRALPLWRRLSLLPRQAEDTTEDAFIQRNAVDIVRQLQKLKGIDGDYENESMNDGQLGRRRTIHNLERHRQKKQAIGTLDVAFKKRFFSISAQAAENGNDTGEAQRKGARWGLKPSHF